VEEKDLIGCTIFDESKAGGFFFFKLDDILN